DPDTVRMAARVEHPVVELVTHPISCLTSDVAGGLVLLAEPRRVEPALASGEVADVEPVELDLIHPLLEGADLLRREAGVHERLDVEAVRTLLRRVRLVTCVDPGRRRTARFALIAGDGCSRPP